jgi:hypothetical protein
MEKRYTLLTIVLYLSFLSVAFAKVREPYLEVPTPTSIWINWKSDAIYFWKKPWTGSVTFLERGE